MALQIKISTPDSPPTQRSIDKHELVIGRKPTSDIVLAGVDVSSAHASVQVDDGQVTLTDLGSLNGTFVNGTRIESIEILPADEVTISTFRLTIMLAEPTPVVREPAFGEAPPLIERGAFQPPGDTLPLPGEPADDGLPPVIRRPTALHPGEPVNAGKPPHQVLPPRPTGLVQVLADPTIRRIFILGAHIEVERDGVRLPLPDPFPDIEQQLTRICGRPLSRELPTECVLPDGTSVQASFAAKHGLAAISDRNGLFAVLTRPLGRRSAGLDGLVQDHVLSSASGELLSACIRAKFPILLVGLGGAPTAPLLTALLGATAGPTCLVRGLPTSAALPRHCTAFDASPGAMPMQVRLALATGAPWLGVDEPESKAIDECAWAAASGLGLALGVRAESPDHALERARLAGRPHTHAPSIPYALIAFLENTEETGVHTSFRVDRLHEVQRDDAGLASTHEIIATGRRGEFIATAVPILLGLLRTHGIHLGPELFAPH